jgi:hypothetical protein
MESQRNTSPHCSTLNKTGYNDIAFSSKLVSNESQLCSCGETRSEQAFNYRSHCSDKKNNLAFTHCGGPQEKW